MWRPPKKQEDDSDSDDRPEVPPKEPNGFDLDEKRKRQAHGKEWAQKTYDEISHGLHDEQRKQKYVNEPKGKRRKNANGN